MTNLTIGETIERDLADEPQSVIRVYDIYSLYTDLREYVLTDHLAREFANVLERVIDSARPGSPGTPNIGIWVSGFFGSGKSHFAKLVGHLLADTSVRDATAREVFKRHLRSDRPGDQRVAEHLQEAANYRLRCHLVPFDIQSHYNANDPNVGLTFLRAFYESLGLSKVSAFAEREIDIQISGRFVEFKELYERRHGVSWDEDKDLTASSVQLAECLTEMFPDRYRDVEMAHQSLELGLNEFEKLTIDGVNNKLIRWLDQRQNEAGADPIKLIFVVDEVGAWTSRDIKRIEQLRNFTESIGTEGQGRIWIVVTSQERLSDVVQNAPTLDQGAQDELLQRLEARYRTNIHLESSEVGTVVEDRILKKVPTAEPALGNLWESERAQLMDIAERPGLDLVASYPSVSRELFTKDYPFLPYQLEMAADLFGSMRSVRIASGARSMIKVVFDATRSVASKEIGAVISWDQIFDSANQDNEFSDEIYLGSHGIEHLKTADRDVTDAPILPTRVLKVLWLMQQGNRIPRTVRNLARFLVDDLNVDVLELERDVETTLQKLEEASFVRQDPTDFQWRYLSEDEVTVEKIVQRIIQQDISFNEFRRALAEMYSEALADVAPRTVNMGTSATPFSYGVYWNDAAVRNADDPVQLRAALDGTASADQARERGAYDLDSPVVYWVVKPASTVDDLLRRTMAVDRLREDDEFKRVATDRTRAEAEKLELEASNLRRQTQAEIERAFRNGDLYYVGIHLNLTEGSNSVRSAIKAALRDRIGNTYYRFNDGDLEVNTRNIDRILSASTSDRPQIDGSTGLFDVDGHLHGNQPVVEEISRYLKSSTKDSGGDIIDYFASEPFGWPRDLVRYTAAAMFADGKLSVVDRSGKLHDDPRNQDARRLFRTATEFRSSRFEVEEESLSPQEAAQARILLTDLGHRPSDTTEIELRDAIRQYLAQSSRRIAVIDKAAEADLPLPEIFGQFHATLDELNQPAPSVTVIRAFLASESTLRDGSEALERLEQFDHSAGFAQYQRSQQLLRAAVQAGLEDDSTFGERIANARAQLEALIDQQRVLETWETDFRRYRGEIIDAFRSIYEPLRRELHTRVRDARRDIMEMPEYKELPLGDRTTVRTRFLSDGKPLAEVDLPELRDEGQLFAANEEYSIAHMRSALAALDSQRAEAQRLVIELYTQHQEELGVQARTVTWNPAEKFGGRIFDDLDELCTAFDTERDRLAALVREGKAIRVV